MAEPAARQLPMKQPNSAYVCQIFTDQADHRLLERFFRDYKPNDVSSLPAFILGMDRLVSDFRSRYHPEAITDGDAQNLEDQAVDEQPEDAEDEDEVLQQDQGGEEQQQDSGEQQDDGGQQQEPPPQDDGGQQEQVYQDEEGNPVDENGNPLEQQSSLQAAAAARFADKKVVVLSAGMVPLDKAEVDRVSGIVNEKMRMTVNAVMKSRVGRGVMIGLNESALTLSELERFKDEVIPELFPDLEFYRIQVHKGKVAVKLQPS